uniref:Fe2OG dioxygenase domain-containing protein n=1 Tax=Odontella aurita TaxID=265563 RepID=A0A6U6CFA5_9STRA|mmetsp:Transcript_11888/g.34845  ORF Transcript_11888/g.34845 Transcript_11888/m.34845 type:complete len:357 (+) Transcript_11888:376-1446(+)
MAVFFVASLLGAALIGVAAAQHLAFHFSPRLRNRKGMPTYFGGIPAVLQPEHELFLGPPDPLQSLNVGESVSFIRPHGSLGGGQKYAVERVSVDPPIFILRGFLSDMECDCIVSAASIEGNMAMAETVTEGDNTSRTHCSVSWLSRSSATIDGSQFLVDTDLLSSVAPILLSGQVLGHQSTEVEDLQVLRYRPGGQYVLHHDGSPRFLTIIHYLNGVGGTWFPLARTGELGSVDDPCRNMNLNHVREKFESVRRGGAASKMNLGKEFIPGIDGVLVKGCSRRSIPSAPNITMQTNEKGNSGSVVQIDIGDAVAFYNSLDDGTFGENWRALHAGLPATESEGDKWIANHWFRVSNTG